VQANVNPLRSDLAQPGRRTDPGRAADKTTHRVRSLLRRKQQCGPVDSRIQANVVDADADRLCLHLRRRQMRAGKAEYARRAARFVLVGSVAAAIHWIVAVVLVDHFALHPLAANLVGWLVAFLFSFSGHHRLTFRDANAPLWRSARRFLAISLGGLTVNESLFATLLHWSKVRYDVALASVLIFVAVLTYVLSRYWAFPHSPTR
jgi:putative flippase GtrA